jgi:signal recognition particle subunit SEC65
MKVFISYAAANENLATEIAKALKQNGLDVWVFQDEVMPGDNWAAKIAQGLEEADAIVVLLTPESLRSRDVRHDIDYALGKKSLNGRLIPVWVGSQDSVPDESFPWILRRLKMINLSGNEQNEEGFRQITQALRAAA